MHPNSNSKQCHEDRHPVSCLPLQHLLRKETKNIITATTIATVKVTATVTLTTMKIKAKMEMDQEDVDQESQQTTTTNLIQTTTTTTAVATAAIKPISRITIIAPAITTRAQPFTTTVALSITSTR